MSFVDESRQNRCDWCAVSKQIKSSSKGKLMKCFPNAIIHADIHVPMRTAALGGKRCFLTNLSAL